MTSTQIMEKAIIDFDGTDLDVKYIINDYTGAVELRDVKEADTGRRFDISIKEQRIVKNKINDQL